MTLQPFTLGSGTTNLYGHVALGDLPHVEAHGGNHVFTELTRLGREISIYYYWHY